MNFNALKIILKIHKKNNLKRSRPETHSRESTSGLVHTCICKGGIPAIVNEKISNLVHDMNFNALKIILKIH